MSYEDENVPDLIILRSNDVLSPESREHIQNALEDKFGITDENLQIADQNSPTSHIVNNCKYWYQETIHGYSVSIGVQTMEELREIMAK